MAQSWVEGDGNLNGQTPVLKGKRLTGIMEGHHRSYDSGTE